MAKLNLPDIGTLANSAAARQAINDNFTAIEAAIENTLSRNGLQPNQMEADLDMDSNDILNVGIIDVQNIYINGVPIGQNFVYGSVAYAVYTADGLLMDFPLPSHPGSLGNLDVSIDGVTQVNGEDFTFTDTILNFAVAPPNLARILVRFAVALPLGTADAGATFYTPPQTSIPGTVQAFLDDLWGTTSVKGSELIRYPNTEAPTFLKTVSDIINGSEVSIDRFVLQSDIPAIRANTSTVDLTTNFQTAFDAFDSTGQGRLYVPRGQYTLANETVLAFNGAVRGDGMGATRFRLTNAGAHGFRVAYSGLVNFTDFDIFAGVPKVAGAGIRYEGLGGSSGQLCRIQNVRAFEQYIGFDMANAGYWKIDGCGIFEPVQFGIYVDNTQNYDAGDNLIHACTIQKTALTSGTAGVQQVASGGTKMQGTKILGFDRGYALIPRVGALSVIDTMLVGNSIEDGNTGIFIQTAVAGTSVGQMTLNSNQMSNKTNGIVLIGAAAGVTMNGNQIAVNFPSHIGIYIDSMNGSPSQVVVNDNQISGNSSVGSIGIYGGNLANNKLSDNQITGCASPYSTVDNTIVRGFELPFALLPTMGNGSYGYVTDGTVASPVAGGGTGCFAKRLNGVWVGN